MRSEGFRRARSRRGWPALLIAAALVLAGPALAQEAGTEDREANPADRLGAGSTDSVVQLGPSVGDTRLWTDAPLSPDALPPGAGSRPAYLTLLFGRLAPLPRPPSPASVYGFPFRGTAGWLRLGWEEDRAADSLPDEMALHFLGGSVPADRRR